MKVLIGADPELFLKKDGQFFSAHKMIPGTKTKPHPVEKGAIQVDGLALEFNIEPAETAEQFDVNIDTVLKHLRSMVPEDYQFDFSATATFTKKHMEEQLPEALVLGCEPWWSAYTQLTAPVPPPAFGNLNRYAGGHVHIGWGEGFDVESQIHIKSCARLAKQLDYYIGLPSVILDNDRDRRKNYGAPGTFRPKPYGMEYRSLSNFWVDKPEVRKFIFNQTQKAVADLIAGKEIINKTSIISAASCMIYSEVGHAKKFIARHPEIYAGMPS